MIPTFILLICVAFISYCAGYTAGTHRVKYRMHLYLSKLERSLSAMYLQHPVMCAIASVQMIRSALEDANCHRKPLEGKTDAKHDPQ